MNKKYQNFLKTSKKINIAIISLLVLGIVGGGVVYATVANNTNFRWIQHNVKIGANELRANLGGLEDLSTANTTRITAVHSRLRGLERRPIVSASPWTTSGTNILRSTGNVGIGRLNAGAQLNVHGAFRTSGRLIIQNTAPTIFFQDTNNRSGMIHMNSSWMHFLRGSGINTTHWRTFNRAWPLALNMNNNDANFGGNINMLVRGTGIRFADGTRQHTASTTRRGTRIFLCPYRQQYTTAPHHRHHYIVNTGSCGGNLTTRSSCTYVMKHRSMARYTGHSTQRSMCTVVGHMVQ